MIAATLFSGIGAPEAAMPGWQWPWCAEIDKFPSAVMAARYPHSTNLGDVSANGFTERAAQIARPRIIVFGSPCQSYSIAGKRLGLDDPRGNLTLVALGIIDRLEPDWFTLENVPDFLSSWSGAADGPAEAGAEWESEETSDFAAFLGQAGGFTESHANAGVMPAIQRGLAVRRLTPRECERLQGFPDDYTLITYRGKPAADGPRYKSLGNSMAVPVIRRILQRIEIVDALITTRKAA